MAKRIGVLRGGLMPYAQVSIASGQQILRHLPAQYSGRDILIDPEGTVHMDGMPIDMERAFAHVDIVWNTLIGPFGSDGKISRYLESHGIPLIGGNSFISAQTSHKSLLRDLLRKNEVAVPFGLRAARNEEVPSIVARTFNTLSGKLIVKPIQETLSQGIASAQSFQDLSAILPEMFARYPEVLIEQHMQGREFALTVVPNFRRMTTYVGIPVEIRKTGSLYSFDEKSDPTNRHIVPSHITTEERVTLTETAKRVSQAINHPGMLRIDCILNKGGYVYVLDVELHPPLVPQEPFRQSLEAAGVTLQELSSHLIQQVIF